MIPAWSTVTEFEKRVAAFFGAPFGVATDSATHGIELALRYTAAKNIYCPKHTYLSVPMLAAKLGIELHWVEYDWTGYYHLTIDVFDAAVLWKAGSYVQGKFMAISFQYQKHLNLGRGGMVLTDNKEAAHKLRKMAYDGRIPGVPWREQNIDTMGYHYYMTPETAAMGVEKLDYTIARPPRIWSSNDYPDLTTMEIFKT